MSKNKLWNSVSIFDTGLSAAEWGWRILTLLFVGGSGTISGIVAKADPIFKELGPVYWIAVALITSLTISIIFYLIKSAYLKQTSASLNTMLATQKSHINPLSENFKDLIISIENLRLPSTQLHENKHFKRCKFVGPSAIAILGGNYNKNTFLTCGDLIALPTKTRLTGLTVLKNCTVEECEFVQLTVLMDQNTAMGFLNTGASVVGIDRV